MPSTEELGGRAGRCNLCARVDLTYIYMNDCLMAYGTYFMARTSFLSGLVVDGVSVSPSSGVAG